MRRQASVLLAAACLSCSLAAALAQETDGAQRQPDPCAFYRGQAYGRGLDHFAAEMLWTCEAIAARQAAAMRLTGSLAAAKAALRRYREAVVAAASARFSQQRSAGRLGLDDALKAQLAESTGALAALDAARTAF